MCAWVRRDTRGQPHPRGIEQQKNALLARDVSTKRETRYWAFRTLWHCEVLTGAYQTLRQRRSLLQLQHHHRCQTLGDFLSRGRDSNRNTFVVLNVVQILQPSEEPRTTASCCSFFRSTGDNSSPRRALYSCAISTVPPVLPVTQTDRGDVSAAASAKAILPLEISLFEIPFRTVDNLDAKMQRPARPGDFSMTARFQTAPLATSFSQIETSSYSQSIRNGPSALHSLLLRHSLGRKSRWSRRWPPVLGRAMWISLPLAAG